MQIVQLRSSFLLKLSRCIVCCNVKRAKVEAFADRRLQINVSKFLNLQCGYILQRICIELIWNNLNRGLSGGKIFGQPGYKVPRAYGQCVVAWANELFVPGACEIGHLIGQLKRQRRGLWQMAHPQNRLLCLIR
uniref:Uncharacterized protein n=1 Tax=Physcomitrium patens TaxID=3218 RepID=A0A2K1INE8_PHYPA|nr:hypothetical protein PHYPA_027117 [Physcomitrium patens]